MSRAHCQRTAWERRSAPHFDCGYERVAAARLHIKECGVRLTATAWHRPASCDRQWGPQVPAVCTSVWDGLRLSACLENCIGEQTE